MAVDPAAAPAVHLRLFRVEPDCLVDIDQRVGADYSKEDDMIVIVLWLLGFPLGLLVLLWLLGIFR